MSLLDEVFAYGSLHTMFSCSAILVAVSGGSDSVCLLDILCEIRKAKLEDPSAHNLRFPAIFAVHVNHQIRPESSGDEELVRILCAKLKIPLFVKTFDVPAISKQRQQGLEETGRDLRREAFAEVTGEISSQGYDTVFIATAHHREDVCETILMNLFRGSGTDGLTGMKPRADRMIRPLLFADKEMILAYVRSRELSYSEDATNTDSAYTRNAFRNEILPAIAKATRRDPVDACLRSAERIREDSLFLEDTARMSYETHIMRTEGATGLPCDAVNRQHRAISGRMIRMLFHEMFGSLTNFTSDHVDAIRDLCAKKINGKRVSLPGRRSAVILDKTLFLVSDNEGIIPVMSHRHKARRLCILPTNSVELDICCDKDSRCFSGDIPQSSLEAVTFGVEKHGQVVYNDRTWYCDAGSLAGAVFRTMRTKDRFRKAGSSGHKPLRRLFTDEKIARELRDRILLVARGDEVLWIPGMYHAEGFIDDLSRECFLAEKSTDGSAKDRPQEDLVCVVIRDKEAKGKFVDA